MGTLRTTTGSLEAMLRQTEREDQQIAAAAAARRIPKDVSIQLPDLPVTYAPAQNTASNQPTAANQTNTPNQSPAGVQNQNNGASQVQPAVLMATNQTKPEAAAAQNDSSIPQPKAASTSTSEAAAPQKTDVATAINKLVSPGNGVSTTSSSARDQVAVSPAVEQINPSVEKTDSSVRSDGSAPCLRSAVIAAG